MAGRTRVKIRWRKGAFAELRTSPSVMAEINAAASRIGASAGSEYTVEPAEKTGGRIRGRAAVIAGSHAAQRDNAKNHSLTRALTQKG